MKRVLLGLIAAAALTLVPAAAQAGHGWHDHGHHRHHSRYGHSHRDHHRGYHGHYDYYRPPVTVYRNPYPSYDYGYGGYGGPNTSFYYSGRNASFGFGF